MKQIVGYTESMSVDAGTILDVYVHTEASAVRCTASVVRARDAGRQPVGPAVRWEAIGETVSFVGRSQTTTPGSYGLVKAPSLGSGESVTFAVNALLTTVSDTTQTLMATTVTPDSGCALVVDSTGHAVFTVAVPGGRTVAVRTERPVELLNWFRVYGGYDAETQQIFVGVARLGADEDDLAPVGRYPCPAFAVGPGQISLATQCLDDDGRAIRINSFIGRLEDPFIARHGCEGAAALDPRELVGSDRLAAFWDFAVGISGFDLVDASGNGNFGTLHNLPQRAVCGSRWDGVASDWTASTDQYSAVHFFDEALEDAEWVDPVRVQVPADAASGFYAVKLVTKAGEIDWVPFFVRPTVTKRADVLLLAPTASYLAYSNARFYFEGPVQEMLFNRVVEIGAEEEFIIAHPEVGLSSYDQYRDGHDVTLVSSKHPNLNMRPGHAREEGYTSDLDIVAWFDHLGEPIDVECDHDLDRYGAELLRHYRTVVISTHPEYLSRKMGEAIAQYTNEGGRLLVLGGNALDITVAFHPERPWIMEVRKPDFSPLETPWHASERHLAFTGGPGGEAVHDDRPSELLIGVGPASMGFDESKPFELQEAAKNVRASFIFDGVEATTVGAHGRLGGGVVGQEWDQSSFELGTPAHALVLARSYGHSIISRRFGALRPQNHAEMVFYETGAGGAVFTVGSMAWCAALADRGYRNDVARISTNVLRRFLSPEPFAGVGAESAGHSC